MADLENKEAVVEEEKNTAEKKLKKDKTKKSAAKKEKKKGENKIKKFLRDYKSEIKKIVWCSPKLTFKYTGLVLVSIVIVGAVIGGLDFVFSKFIMFLGTLV